MSTLDCTVRSRDPKCSLKNEVVIAIILAIVSHRRSSVDGVPAVLLVLSDANSAVLTRLIQQRRFGGRGYR